MRSYRFARRAFLASVGGAFGLEVMLRNLEAAAQGVKSPARFVLAHWPLGTMKYRFVPEVAGAGYVAPPILQPFETAGLRNDMTAFYGFSDGHLRCPGGGGAEAGTPFTTTCCDGAGTRKNGGESDDGVAGGPSFDQVFLKNVPDLRRPGLGYVNSICDARVDSFETSTQCLSYSYDTRVIQSAQPADGTITEYTPLMPQLSPARQYAALFSNFMPGGATTENQKEALRALQLRKSVLDYALGELGKLKRVAPASEAAKIEIHTEAIRKLELQLTEGSPAGECSLPGVPPDTLQGKVGNTSYQEPTVDDTQVHRAVAEAHLAIITAAFQCDIIRVATFQFAPGTSHVAFKGMFPSDPERLGAQQPMSHSSVILSGGSQRSPVGLSGANLDAYEFMANVHTWYNQRMADWLTKLKTTPDVQGGNLLDYTVIPFITERADGSSVRSPKPALLFGGGKLGLKHGTFQSFSPVRPQVDLYLTCAQALLGTADPLSVLSGERFVQFNANASVIPGLWSPPA
ncbi:MAG TPA: DUF1552 domain-containing protein [Polyangiaceae bacterium]|nr:DUF1552 domain-containing protein [Polyangiaceae bacterium]